MAEAIRMPLLSDTMKEGIIAEWHKKVGDTVKSDDIIAEVETDKATMEVMPYVDGTLLYIGVEKGKGVPVNGIMAIIGKPGEDFQSILDGEGGARPAAAPAQEAPAAPAAAPQAPASAPAPQAAAPQQAAAPAPVAPAAQEAPAAGGDDRVKASPLAKRLAEEKGVDIQAVKGSGDNGRIIKRDIDNYTPAPAAAAAPAGKAAPATIPVFNGQEGHTDTPLTQMRRIIAQRLAESKFSAPHFYLRMTINMDNAMEARKAINAVSPEKVSFNDMVIKACAMALRKHPAVNSSWMGDFIRQNHHIHIGSAVAVDEGLIVPVVRFADQKGLAQIAQEAGVLIDKARTKKIQPQEFTGNTFTISNLGMMDIDEFTAIINPPDSCILAVGKIAATPVVENGAVVVRNLMKLTLSCDHRVVDGAVGSRFLQTLKTYLENPVTMLV
ncbi:pyruvate dehydrogenase complex dihydrolipoamide acetyltransferase [Nemorincola caseinilytica]|uniref:Acetyltransferase component of pyruvate dehydrogenase complex n=1 Tax=Nemorincola caseinilytica TaxID=2054315 RepID=A0ABP8NMV1_9BACT